MKAIGRLPIIMSGQVQRLPPGRQSLSQHTLLVLGDTGDQCPRQSVEVQHPFAAAGRELLRAESVSYFTQQLSALFRRIDDVRDGVEFGFGFFQPGL